MSQPAAPPLLYSSTPVALPSRHHSPPSFKSQRQQHHCRSFSLCAASTRGRLRLPQHHRRTPALPPSPPRFRNCSPTTGASPFSPPISHRLPITPPFSPPPDSKSCNGTTAVASQQPHCLPSKLPPLPRSPPESSPLQSPPAVSRENQMGRKLEKEIGIEREIQSVALGKGKLLEEENGGVETRDSRSCSRWD